MNELEVMVAEARIIEAFCNSSYASDWELSVRSEQFKAKWGRNWTSCIPVRGQENALRMG